MLALYETRRWCIPIMTHILAPLDNDAVVDRLARQRDYRYGLMRIPCPCAYNPVVDGDRGRPGVGVDTQLVRAGRRLAGVGALGGIDRQVLQAVTAAGVCQGRVRVLLLVIERHAVVFVEI